MPRSIPCLALAGALTLAGAASSTALRVGAEAPPAGIDLGVPGRSSATPSIAASGHLVAIVWGASTKDDTAVYAATSRDAGRTFGAPVRVSDDRTRARLSGEQPPRVVFTPAPSAVEGRQGSTPSIVIVWTSKAATGTVLVSARSTDGGTSFTKPVVIAGSSAAGNRGWESIAADASGNVVALWLDHRELAAASTKTDGVARAQLSKLFFARLDQSNASKAIASGVCYCCKTSIATGVAGTIYATWRHVYPGNMRDIAFTMSRDGGHTFAAPVRVSEDRWSLDGCPENGPAMAVDDFGRVHIVWPTLIPAATPDGEGTAALFYAASTDGRRFTPRQRIAAEGMPRHAQMALTKSELVAVWDEASNGANNIAFARAAIGNTAVRLVRQPLDGATSGMYPVVAVAGGAAVVAWVTGPAGQSTVRVHRVIN